jgi:hypothetical protein
MIRSDAAAHITRGRLIAGGVVAAVLLLAARSLSW